MAEGERATGTPNTIYDLSSVLFHALEGGASYDQYIRDAEGAGDEELAGFFRQVRNEDSRRADEAQQLLAERTSTATTGLMEGAMTGPAGGAASASPRTEPSSTPPGVAEELPPTREVEEPAATGGVSRGTEPIVTPPGEDIPPARAQETVPPRPEPSGDFPGTEPIREEVPPAGAGGLPPMTEGAVPSRMEDVPMAEEVPSGIPPQAPPGEVPRAEEERAEREEREEDKGLIDKARDYLRGEDRERDYPPRRGE